MTPHVHLITELGSVADGHASLLLIKGTGEEGEGQGWGRGRRGRKGRSRKAGNPVTDHHQVW